MIGATLAELRDEGLLVPTGASATTSRSRRRCCPSPASPTPTPLLGPEMRSTGEVMGIDLTVGLAFAKSQLAAGSRLPDVGHGVPVAGRPGQGHRRAGRRSSSSSSASPSRPPRAPPTTCASHGVEVATVVAKLGEPTGTTRSS